MKLQIIDGVEVHSSSGNVYADIGLADAEQLKIKTVLVIEIRKVIKLSQNLESFVESAKNDDFYWVEKIKLDFAIELDRCRRDLNMTDAEFAKELGVSRAYLSKLFRGDVNLTIKSMVKLARAAGARISLSTHD
jgi:transcriptional regulator with XRE-family HTH domain